jgi:SMI1 / KNR4 family (SUKH-1)
MVASSGHQSVQHVITTTSKNVNNSDNSPKLRWNQIFGQWQFYYTSCVFSGGTPRILGTTTMNEPFADFDLSDFWLDSDYAREAYVSPAFSANDVARVENELGYKLPDSYLALMRTQNGGIPSRTHHRTGEQTNRGNLPCLGIRAANHLHP